MVTEMGRYTALFILILSVSAFVGIVVLFNEFDKLKKLFCKNCDKEKTVYVDNIISDFDACIEELKNTERFFDKKIETSIGLSENWSSISVTASERTDKKYVCEKLVDIHAFASDKFTVTCLYMEAIEELKQYIDCDITRV